MLQPTPEGKAIWKATVTSDTGWSHRFTLLRLAPALIWEARERPAAFAGSVVVVDTATDEADSASPEAPESASAPVAQQTTPEPQPFKPASTIGVNAMDELIALMELSQASEPEAPAQPATQPVPVDVQPPSPKLKSSPIPTHTDVHPAPSAEHFMI